MNITNMKTIRYGIIYFMNTIPALVKIGSYHNIKRAPVIPKMIKTTKVNIPRNPSGLTNLEGNVNLRPMKK